MLANAATQLEIDPRACHRLAQVDLLRRDRAVLMRDRRPTVDTALKDAVGGRPILAPIELLPTPFPGVELVERGRHVVGKQEVAALRNPGREAGFLAQRHGAVRQDGVAGMGACNPLGRRITRIAGAAA